MKRPGQINAAGTGKRPPALRLNRLIIGGHKIVQRRARQMENGKAILGHPFASITWIRFSGSRTRQRPTLSLHRHPAVGWLPGNKETLGWESENVKLGEKRQNHS
jgi:hypothetical protein